jgi:hypothetical protein
MADKPWKQFEREMGKLLEGTRFWANSGESVDCEGPIFLAQCKHVKSMSLNTICDLAEQAEFDGKNRVSDMLVQNGYEEPYIDEVSDPRIGVVGIKTRPGKGKKAQTIVVMTANVFRELFPTQGG